jgi:hypothetical protein
MLNHAEVFGPHAKHGSAVDFGLAAHKVRLLRMERFAVLVLPGFLGVVAIVEENGGRIPVEFFLGHERAALEDEDFLPRLGQVQGQRSPSRPSANHNRVEFLRHAHLQHRRKLTSIKRMQSVTRCYIDR